MNRPDCECIFTSGTIVNGKISGPHPILFQGELRGETDIQNTLIIGDLARSQATLQATNIIIDGQQSGDIFASDSILVSASATVKGDLSATSAFIEKGAKFSGKIDLSSE